MMMMMIMLVMKITMIMIMILTMIRTGFVPHWPTNSSEAYILVETAESNSNHLKS